MATLSLLGAVACVFFLGRPIVAELKREIICKMSAYPNGYNINWSCPGQMKTYVDIGLYNPRNILPSRVQMVNNRAFLVTPRFLCGVPFTLGTICLTGACKAEPTLSPYPNWASHEERNGAPPQIINAVDIYIDKKRIMWILDIGIVETLNNPKVVCSPKVHAICIQSNQIVASIDLGPYAGENSRFHEIQVEVTEEDDTYIYVSDAGCKGFVVYDYSKDVGFKIPLPPEIAADGSGKDILYITMLAGNILYFSFMNGCKMYRIDTRYLRCPKPLTNYEEVGAKPGKLVILGTDQKCKLFFRGKGDNQIYVWEQGRPFTREHFARIDCPIEGLFSTHVVVGFMKYIWSISSNFPDFASGNRGLLGPYTKLHPICTPGCPEDGGYPSLWCPDTSAQPQTTSTYPSSRCSSEPSPGRCPPTPSKCPTESPCKTSTSCSPPPTTWQCPGNWTVPSSSPVPNCPNLASPRVK